MKRKHARLVLAVCALMLLQLCSPALGALAEEGTGRFYSNYASLEEAREASLEINREIAEQGVVLLRNENETLPLEGVHSVSVFGNAAEHPFYAGDAGAAVWPRDMYTTIYDSLESAGYSVNPVLRNFYRQQGAGEKGPEAFTGLVLDSYRRYDEAAVIVIGRGGDVTPEALRLSPEEEALVRHVTERFDTVVVVINSANPMELGWVEDGSLGEIGACLWVGHPGLNGFAALGEILHGDVSPSGRLPDIWPADMTRDPAYANDAAEGDGLRTVEYAEGVYYGYRWYETAAAEGVLDYDESVVYPFGYGLSYTEFDQALDSVERGLDGDDNAYYEITVTVENTGTASGREVVQVYYTPPYTPGGVEKPYATLGAFDKTRLLKPGQSETLTLTLYEQDMASYDYNDANGDGHTGYELDGGTYYIRLMKNSHEEIDRRSVSVEEQSFDTDRLTGGTVENLFSSLTEPDENSLNLAYDDEGEALYGGLGGPDHDMALLSRADLAGTASGVLAVKAEPAGAEASQEAETSTGTAVSAADLMPALAGGGLRAERDTPWYSTYRTLYNRENPGNTQTWDQGVMGETVLHLSDMTGLDWDDPLWIDFINQFTWEQLTAFLANGGGRSMALSDALSRRYGAGLEGLGAALVEEESLGIPYTEQAGGPVALRREVTGSGKLEDAGILWASPVNLAATWNTDLAEKRGIMVGEEAMQLSLNGWYGVAVGIHRAPWGASNYESFSEDPLLTGRLAAAEIAGIQSKGVAAFIESASVSGVIPEAGAAGTGDEEPAEEAAEEEPAEEVAAEEPAEEAAEEEPAEEVAAEEPAEEVAAEEPAEEAAEEEPAEEPAEEESAEEEPAEEEPAEDATDEESAEEASSGEPAAYGGGEPVENAGPLLVFADEQTLREIYLKPFRLAVQEGHAKGLAVSGGGIGLRADAGNFSLLTSLLRQEWGFEGYTVAAASNGADAGVMTRAGVDLFSGGGVAGEWNDAARCVEVNGERNDIAWAAARLAVKRVMYVNANSSAMGNNLGVEAFAAGEAIEVSLGRAAEATVAADADTLGSANVRYVLEGELPPGMEFDEYTGSFGGTPTETGSYELSVTMYADGGWVHETNDFTIEVVNDLFEVTPLDAMTGMPFAGAVVSKSLMEEGKLALYTAEGLPEGVTMSQEGILSGQPAEAGEFDVVIHAQVGDAAGMLTGALGDKLGGALGIDVGETLGSVTDTLSGAAEAVSGAVDTVTEAADTVTEAADAVGGAVDAAGAAADTVTEAADAVGGAVDSAGAAAGTVTDAAGAVTDAVEMAFSADAVTEEYILHERFLVIDKENAVEAIMGEVLEDAPEPVKKIGEIVSVGMSGFATIMSTLAVALNFLKGKLPEDSKLAKKLGSVEKAKDAAESKLSGVEKLANKAAGDAKDGSGAKGKNAAGAKKKNRTSKRK